MAGYALVLAAVAIAVYAAYRLLLPKPIPGIPYNEAASRSILGDIPTMLSEGKEATFTWMISQASKRPGPLFQFFLNPFDKPFVLLTDYRESRDILLRRKEWDRSDWSIDILGGQLAKHHINMKTGAAWKAHRRLLQDLMSPSFLNEVAAPNIYHSAEGLVQLWREKVRVADDRSFSTETDVYYAALDAVLDFGFGDSFPHRAIPHQQKLIGTMDTNNIASLSKDSDMIEFEKAPIHETLESMLQISDAIGAVADTGMVKLAWWWRNRQPAERKARGIRDTLVKEQVLMAKDRLLREDGEAKNKIKSAIDLMVNREKLFAEKDGRQPVFWSDDIRDEILGFVVAGHDTTSTTLLWAVKYLTDSPDSQKKLRDALRSTHSNSYAEGRPPTYREISSANCGYLEAFIEESLRLANTVPVLERQCDKDTVILGHHLPKGTTLLLATNGPSITETGRQIDESLRSESSRVSAKERDLREWSSHNPSAFFPERWLEKNPDSDELSFNPQAGPTLPFGLGLRGCYGRKLAYLELRLMVTLLVWNFEFKPTPARLSGYEPVDGLTHKPKTSYVRLEPVKQ
ncbi:unnamed protein product [Clonostachys chloroleuca]|uniref:Cytochrome P450 n=1 Tax=Clonostachys chloroleuca TaxID=1926264 RepID=A0AA35QB66_9HYPO|nr:unnamed protein product [Clonostachys chloroleuca]